MHQLDEKFVMFRNRLEKVYRHLRKQASKQGVSCFRIYDHDLPEFPLLIEKYDDQIYISEYKRNHQLEEDAYQEWLKGSIQLISQVTDVQETNIHSRLRKRKEGRTDQYQKASNEKVEYIVEEGGLRFIVNLTEYLDTGLFLDHRITRALVRDRCDGKKMLNLFCYTGSFSVYAIHGGATEVTSIDLSNTYLSWAQRNIELNFPGDMRHRIVQADVLQWMKESDAAGFDVIVMDPPTFSNSKRMEGILDIQRDHVFLINACLKKLNKGGVLYFSTNFRKFKLEEGKINGKVKDITKATTPFDFAGKLHRFCFEVRHSSPFP